MQEIQFFAVVFVSHYYKLCAVNDTLASWMLKRASFKWYIISIVTTRPFPVVVHETCVFRPVFNIVFFLWKISFIFGFLFHLRTNYDLLKIVENTKYLQPLHTHDFTFYCPDHLSHLWTLLAHGRFYSCCYFIRINSARVKAARRVQS